MNRASRSWICVTFAFLGVIASTAPVQAAGIASQSTVQNHSAVRNDESGGLTAADRNCLRPACGYVYNRDNRYSLLITDDWGAETIAALSFRSGQDKTAPMSASKTSTDTGSAQGARSRWPGSAASDRAGTGCATGRGFESPTSSAGDMPRDRAPTGHRTIPRHPVRTSRRRVSKTPRETFAHRITHQTRVSFTSPERNC